MLATNERAIMEYHAPVFDAGILAGQVRLGFFKPGYRLLAEEVSIAAALALLVFLLAPLFYFLLKREIRPIAMAGVELEKLLHDRDTSNIAVTATVPLGAFMDRFNQFVDYSQARISELESGRGELVASAKLISYKKTRIEAVLQTLPEAVLILDEHGKVTYANDRVTMLLGASKEQVLTMHSREWCANSEVVEFLSRYETSTASRYMNDTVQFKPLEKSDKTLSLNGYPLFSSNDSTAIYGTLVVIRDVTRESLAKQSRSEFVAHLGHELKTPLNTLALYSEVLLDDAFEDPAERIEAVNTIHDEVERLTDLVNNLLSITRIEMGSLDLDKQRTRLSDLLQDIADNLGRAASQQNVTVELSLPRDLSPVEVDKEMLRVAINNLLSNAIKYNQVGGEVRVSAEETEEAVLIHVTDKGMGISDEDKERIFERFFPQREQRNADADGARSRPVAGAAHSGTARWTTHGRK